MVENHFAVTSPNAKTQELQVTPVAKLKFDGDWEGPMVFLTQAPIERIKVEWDCPFCKATVYETNACECGATLEVVAMRRVR